MDYESHPPEQPAAPHADALEILSGDHAAIRALFEEFASYAEQPTGAADRHGVLARLGALLRAHGQLETTLFYPALERYLDPTLLGRALADHAEIDAELERVAEADPDDEDFAERFATLAGDVLAHLFEEERSIFPHAKQIDLAALGALIAKRRAELMGNGGAVD